MTTPGGLAAIDGSESRGERRAWFLPDQAQIPRAELASADESANFCRGPVMRVDRVLDVCAVATLGVRVMPKVFEDVEDDTLCARAIFGRDLSSSNAACHLRARSATFVPRPIYAFSQASHACSAPAMRVVYVLRISAVVTHVPHRRDRSCGQRQELGMASGTQDVMFHGIGQNLSIKLALYPFKRRATSFPGEVS